VAWYLDTSAAVKLVIAEAESAALRTWLNRRELVASDLLRIELLRAVRHHDPSSRLHAREVLEVAISLGSDLEGVVAYDERMRQACRALGLSVESPMP